MKSDNLQEDLASPLPNTLPYGRSGTGKMQYIAWLTQLLRPVLVFVMRPFAIIRGYSPAFLQPDIVAGLTVAVIILPQAMAYALISEIPPAMGLYAAVIGAIVGALWGSSNHLQTGPTNTTSLIVLSALLAVARPGTSEYLLAAGLMAIIVGTIQILMAVARLGVMVNFISDAVIVGFTAGAGVLIGINQMRHLLRLSVPSRPGLWETLPEIAAHISETHLLSLLIGLATMAIILIVRRYKRKLPPALIAMVAVAALVALFRLDQQGVRVVGELPRTLPPFNPPSMRDLGFISRLATGSLAVAAIALVESVAIARGISAQSGQRLDSDQEFFGQGLANIMSGLFSGYVVAGSFTRSVVNHKAGARTSLGSAFAGIFVLLTMLLLAPLAGYVPLAALAGVIIVTAYSLIDRQEISRIWRSNHGDRTIMLITIGATLTLPLEFAVLLGIGLSILYYLLQTSKPRVRVVLPSADYRYFTPRPGMPSCTQLGVVEILGDLYFGAVNHIEKRIQENLERNPTQRYLLLRMYPVENCDISGIHALESIVNAYRDHGGDVYFVHVHARVRELMHSTGFYETVGADHFLGPDEAVPHLFHQVLDPAICIYECPVRVFSYCQNLPKRLDLIRPHINPRYPPHEVPQVHPRELWAALHQDLPPRVIDVREPREFRQSHVPGAESLPFNELANGVARIPTNGPIVVVCQGGRRSTWAAALLLDQGHEDVRVMEGGMSAWDSQHLLAAIDLRK